VLPFVPFRHRRPSAGRAAPADADVPALLVRLAAGDRAALDTLYRRESGLVYRYALALSGNAAWAADATQEAFIALATRPQGFDASRGTLGAYLAGVARHALQAVWRSQRLEDSLEPGPDEHPDAADEPGTHALQGTSPSPEALLVRTQDNAQLWAALRTLPAPMREALVLVDLQERPYAEAARIAGCEINTLRTRLHRARLKLAALLSADGGSPT
jgi:RNA polymerase sigma-70 factor (ECF subfamily)